MKRSALVLLFVFGLAGTSTLFSQGFQPPADGKAVVYFARVTGYGGAVSFEYFHNDRYIGVFKKKNYMRYELDPGEQLLWISSENKEFITADLKAGGTYIVVVDVIMGFAKARVGTTLVTDPDSELFERAKELIMSKPPVVTEPEKIEKMNEKLADFIQEKLQQYEEDWKNSHDFHHISPDMAIPPEALQ
jgi:hypothetical protein